MGVIPSRQSGITFARGFLASGVCSEIKSSHELDLAVIISEATCSAAGVFTKCKTRAAAVQVSSKHITSGRAQGIVCSSGNANAGTGLAGIRDAQQMCRWVAEQSGTYGLTARDVLVCSTGIIGHRLPMQKIRGGIGSAMGRLDHGRTIDTDVARAIMTTDLVPKSSSRTIQTPGGSYCVGGVAKGSGMIAPNMATMLCFLTTDVAITPKALRAALKVAVGQSFNRISVDGHMSPSDTVLVLANGMAGGRVIRGPGVGFDRFCAGLSEVCGDLAYQVVQDGEGATRVMRVVVKGAASERDADRIGKAVVDSPLVKAAVHGKDPNWGRITTAAAGCGAKLVEGSLSLSIGGSSGVCVYRKGTPVVLPSATRTKLRRLMNKKEVVFVLDLGLGQESCEWLGCDLSAEYVRINAEYTT